MGGYPPAVRDLVRKTGWTSAQPLQLLAQHFKGVHSAKVQSFAAALVTLGQAAQSGVFKNMKNWTDTFIGSKTPWGEIAWQLGGKQAFELVAEHDAQGISPGGDVLDKVIPDTPCLILMDELMNYISRNRKSGLSDQFYNFLQNLTETVRGKEKCVLAGEPSVEFLVGADQAGLVGGHEDGAELVDHLIGEGWVGTDFRVDADERIAQFTFQQNLS